MKRVARKRPDRHARILQRMIEEGSDWVLMESTRASIEKFAEEYVRDALSDPVWREMVRQETRSAVRNAVLALLKPAPVARKRRRAHA
jgi:hypothetical protein